MRSKSDRGRAVSVHFAKVVLALVCLGGWIDAGLTAQAQATPSPFTNQEKSKIPAAEAQDLRQQLEELQNQRTQLDRRIADLQLRIKEEGSKSKSKAFGTTPDKSKSLNPLKKPDAPKLNTPEGPWVMEKDGVRVFKFPNGEARFRIFTLPPNGDWKGFVLPLPPNGDWKGFEGKFFFGPNKEDWGKFSEQWQQEIEKLFENQPQLDDEARKLSEQMRALMRQFREKMKQQFKTDETPKADPREEPAPKKPEKEKDGQPNSKAAPPVAEEQSGGERPGRQIL